MFLCKLVWFRSALRWFLNLFLHYILWTFQVVEIIGGQNDMFALQYVHAPPPPPHPQGWRLCLYSCDKSPLKENNLSSFLIRISNSVIDFNCSHHRWRSFWSHSFGDLIHHYNIYFEKVRKSKMKCIYMTPWLSQVICKNGYHIQFCVKRNDLM